MRIILLLLLSAPAFLFAQTNNYKPLHNIGTIPDDFLSNRSGNFNISDVSSDSSSLNKRLFQKFALSSNYYIFNHLVNGYVMYGTVVNEFVNEVADKILTNEPMLRKKLRFYITEYPEVNAYTFTNGVICINIGLLAKLESEAALAFILCHEIAHYKQGHSFKKYTHYRTLDKKSKKELEDEESGRLHVARFSREHEIEADQYGFELYKKTGYSLEAALSVFDVLAKSAYPFDSVPISRSFVNSRYLTIPVKYYIDTAVTAIELDTAIHDSLRSHPAIPKRREWVFNEIKSLSKEGEYYLVSRSRFESCRDIARYELGRIYLQEGEYMNSLYNTYLLLLKDPDDEYLNACVVKNLYFIQRSINSQNKSDVVKNRKKIKGEVTRLNFMFQNMRADELNAWCLRKAWDIHKRFPENTEIIIFTRQITADFKAHVSEDIAYFKDTTEYDENLIQSFYNVTDVEVSELNRKKNRGKKVSRIKSQIRGTFANYAMADYITDVEFRTIFTSEPFEKKGSDENPEEEDSNKKRTRRKNSRAEKVKTYDVRSVIIADLTNLKLDERRHDQVMYTAIGQHTDALIRNMLLCADKNDLELKMMIPESFNQHDSLAGADRAILQKYFDNRMAHEEWKTLFSPYHAELEQIAQRNNTPYVGYLFNVGIIKKKDRSWVLLNIFGALITYPPLVLVAVYDAFEPERESYLGFVLYDTRNGKCVFKHNQAYNTNSHQDLMKAELYNIFYKIRHK